MTIKTQRTLNNNYLIVASQNGLTSMACSPLRKTAFTTATTDLINMLMINNNQKAS